MELYEDDIEKYLGLADNDNMTSYCIEDVRETCYSSARPIDFIYERRHDIFSLEKYETDEKLVAKI